MSLPKVVFLDRATIPSHIVIPKIGHSHQWVEYDYTQPEQVLERIQDADIVISNKVYLGETQLKHCSNLALIAVAATGYNNVDIHYCQARNIGVTNVRGYAQQSVPEHVIAMMFSLRRNLMGYHNDIVKGEWQRNKQFCFFTHAIGDIAGSTLGIVGSGALGQATASLARAIGMQVVFAERKGAEKCREGYLPFETVLSMSDVLSLHCPLSQETHNLIGEPELQLMKSNAILINTGRGGLVDEHALVNALEHSIIAAAGVDVFTQEPADINNPLLDNAHLPNLLLTPHVAWGSDSAIQSLANILIDNIDAFLRTEEQNRVV
ncbi:D-2-hydroxyacid dehydrogenase [Vibrio agarivorans]|uniref:D-2-hydroxyacid dehydrogenase n=1 Tax=Vibrio agarivorans TaxID=153622 RepID=A0ABT7Y213_9VIBR|nr:D-2-hydroxyacid dehydrogenase [Vibrio agarivorans]MDN2482083.1 D-2-hydroxyacid dehydrogenase [Vibrio agarivorans]